MNATVNGRPTTLPDDATLAHVLADLELPPSGIAVAVNERVVSRASFASHALRDGDAIEIVRAVAGG